MKTAGLDMEPKEFDSLAVGPQEAQGRVTSVRGPVEMRDFDDPVAIRKNIFAGVKQAFLQKTMENKDHVLRFADVDYDSPGDFTLQDEKNAILGRKRLYWNLKGRMQLLDKATGALISEDEKPRKLAEVPYATRRGTFIHNGTEYLTSHQMRLKPGAYTRVQNNGDVETQFNVLKGSSFRVHMTPETGVFRINAGQAQMKLYPVLKAMGIDDKVLLEAWGKDLLNANRAADDKTEGSTVQKLVQRLGSHLDQELPPEEAAKRLPEIFKRMELDPEVMRRTMGKPHTTVDQHVILDATKKILRVHQGQDEADDRDDLPYQSFHGPEDFFREHVEKDAGQYIRQALWKAGFKKDVRSIPEGYFTKQLQSILLGSGLSSSLTEINPAEIYDMRHKITRMGEGGIGSSDVVPKGARGVQPTHFGFIDPLRAPESQKIALDLRTTQGTKVGNDGRLYQRFWSPRKKAFEYLHTDAAADNIIAFPGELEKAQGKPKQKVRAMVGGKMSYVPAAKVDYELPHASGMWSPLTWMVPFMSGVKGARVGMGARMQSQALALREPEAPLVMPIHHGSGKGFHEHIGEQMGAVKARKPGVIKKVTPEGIEVQHLDGTTEVYETYNNMPFNQKGFIHNTPVVKPGAMVNPGDLLARSNYTDDKGRAAIGKNVVAAWHMLDGLTHEDAIAISETAAKKFASEQMYEFSKERGEDIHEISKNSYISQFPSTYSKQQLERMDDDGVVAPGTVLKKGDPIILAVGKQYGAIRGSIMKGRKSSFSDAAETWEHDAEAEVVDVRKTPRGPVVTLKSYTPMQPGDKLSGLFGNKGVVSKIIPDAEMLQTSDGKPVDIVMNPMGIISRVNPASLAEAALGKIAKRTGKSYTVEGFPKGSIAQFALDELAKNGMNDTETIIDPKTGRHIRDVFVGVPYVMKLHHMSEGKMGARETAHYTMDGLPAKGGAEGSKRFGFMEVMGLMSHGVPHFVQDMKLTRGQRNDEFWRMYRLGMTPPAPRISRQYQKFETTLQGAGVSLRKKDGATQIFPATQKEIEALGAGREITVGETVDFDTGEPVKGGLFDVAVTGGQGGEHWSHVKLAEPLPNPLMEDPFRSFLGLTKDRYREILAGREEYNGVKGPQAIRRALENFNLSREIAATTEAIKAGKKSARDALVKRLGFLKAFERLEAHPRDFLLDRVPVLPPKFRPVSKFKDTTISADANYLYKDLIEANENLKQAKEAFGEENTSDIRLQTYDAFKAVVGLGNPIQPETQERNVRGLLKQIVGTSPKYGNFQRRVIGNPVDFVGRSVIIPGANMDIDEVGLPVDMMWTLFKPFTIRKLSRAGMPMQKALQEWKQRTPRATQALMAEAAMRPVVINRAPTLHKYNLTGHFARPVAGHAMQLSNLILKGHNADYDGDALNIHVPVGDKAVDDVKEKMLPSKMLYSTKAFDVHMLPDQGFVTGLYMGSRENKKRKPRTFASPADAVKAYRSGELDVDDPIVILRGT